MSTKPSATPGHRTTTTNTPSSHSQAQAQAKRPKKTPNPTSEGGVMLPPTTQSKPASTPAANDTTQTGPNRRRRPRKLNREPASASTAPKKEEGEAVGTELEALKSRVRGLEAKVEDLYKAGSGSGAAKSPRRRGKGRKGSTPALLTAQSSEQYKDAEGQGGVEAGDADADADVAELLRLEDELAVARLDLATLASAQSTRPRAAKGRMADGEDEDVEEVPRGAIPSGADGQPRASRQNTNSNGNDKSVTLTGSYRIPLPAAVSIDDVRSIQSGISSAQAVARSFLDQRRETAAKNPKPAPAPQRRTTSFAGNAKGAEKTPAAAEVEGEGQSWGEWFGAYSMSISRAVKKIEAEAGVEVDSQPRAARPIAGPRRASAPGGKAVAKKGAANGAAASGARTAAAKGTPPSGGGGAAKGAGTRRPPLKPRESNPGSGAAARVSGDQVKTLLS